jgi:cyclic lactone autoinducer peptide
MLKKAIRRLMGAVPALALLLAAASVSSACFFCLHQPDIPDELKNAAK